MIIEHFIIKRDGEIVDDLKKGVMNNLPVLPLQHVLFPNQIIPIYIGEKQSLKLVTDVSKQSDKTIIVVAQKDEKVENPKGDDLYEIATLGNCNENFDMPDNQVRNC